MTRYTYLLLGEGSASHGCRLSKPHRLARLALRGPFGSGQPQGARQKRAPAARSPGWRGSRPWPHPSRAGWHTTPSSTAASPEQLASFQSARLAPSPCSPETRTCLDCLPHDGPMPRNLGLLPSTDQFLGGTLVGDLGRAPGPLYRCPPLQSLPEEFLARREVKLARLAVPVQKY
ncbi:hypothetical protein GW17_00028106 [Ensete ventricosum]|nr:hypothetical protein GW17_00028106 [Ensete ventricosum]